VNVPDSSVRAHQQLIDELWDFADPAASRRRFEEAAREAVPPTTAVLSTQVGRALGLTGAFPAALAMLDSLPQDDAETRIRTLLERGRVLNSSGSPQEARQLFESALSAANAAGFEFLAIDALHMLAIVAPAEEQVALNERALELASAAADPRAREWRASLLNNLGWARFEAGEVGLALELFTEAVAERERHGKARELGVARWSVARTLRELGRVEEALAAQVELAHWMTANDLSDSYVEEEIGECLVALGRSEEAAGHFATAARLLEVGGPGESADPQRLAALRERAQMSTTPEPGSG